MSLTTSTQLTPQTIGSQLAQRRERAKEQANQYGLFRQPNGVYSVVSRDGERVYEATTLCCSCPDFERRGQELGCCKHIYMVRSAEEEREEQVRARTAKIAAARRMMALDFPAED